MSEPLLPLLMSLLAFLIAAGSPGPATLAVAGTSMARGRAQGLAMALGLATGLALWGVLVGLGFAMLLTRFALALSVLKLVGAAYLFYLAATAARSAFRKGEPDEPAARPMETGQVFRRGLLLNLLNPKAALAWVAALVLGSGDALTIALCAALGLAIYLAYATLFSLTPVMAFYRRGARALDACFAAFFAWAGLRLLVWRVPE